ncbi:histone-lysine N-methyltransferase, H3 lysine-79 specific-like [Copidosoma floridanum]|uniref:histone-lysine N-methyltransferase, H3 lysine-79 specific-like n=1 Tax=Copidosoma floridanum TaxID=29053 RepID=UPI0006C94E32|nr:histone-lysine N-methyltransferase, H3 lysine-79 specific-like [Copidosoma floridanum]
MEYLNSSQISEQMTLYENKIKSWKDKIRAELKIRQNLKEKLSEAKKREATQILMLERLDEYEEIVTKQLELAEKMEDSESVKQLAVIEKYEGMLREQQQVWAQYEEEYEQLPLAQERQKAELRLLKVSIQNDLVIYKLNEINKMIKLEEKVNRRQEQLKIIELAKLYLDHKKKERYCSELISTIQHLKLEEENLKQQVKDAERQAEETERLNPTTSKSIKSQQLPKVDLSCFIIRRDNNNYNNYDTVSINSYILEQEYMNVEEPASQSSQPEQQFQHKKFVGESQESNFESMDLDRATKRPDGQQNTSAGGGTINDSRMDVDETETDNQAADKSKQPRLNHVASVKNFERHGESNSYIHCKKSSQESQPETHANEKRETPQKRVNQRKSSQEEAPNSRGFVRVPEERINYSSPYHPVQERPVPSPAKLQKQSFESPQQQHQRESFSRTDARAIFNSKDLARLPQASPGANRPQMFKLNDSLPHQNQTPNVQAAPVAQSSRESSQNTSALLDAQMPRRPSPIPQQSFVFMDNQQQQQHQQQQMTSNINSPSIVTNSMLNMTMNSCDVNMYADNISAILGSEITEPGGSFELVRRLYGDSDLNSEVSDLEYDKMMEKLFSPIPSKAKNQPEQQQQQQQQHRPGHAMSQASRISLNSNVPISESQEQEKSFALTGFKKSTKTAKSLF